MTTQNKVAAKSDLARNDEKELTASTKRIGHEFSPTFVEAEKMFDRYFRLNEEIGHRAFELFLRRDPRFGTAFDDWLAAESEVLLPFPVEITENKNQFKVKADVHGFRPEEIEVSVKDNLVILSGETDAEERTEEDGITYRGWHSRRFFRALPLPGEIDPDGVKAKLKGDVLQLALPKLAEHRPKNIEITAG